MAAPTETYIDPSIAGASGAGTVGDPYGDIQHALDTVTRDATNGDRLNIKAGTDEILTAALDVTGTYGTPSEAAPLIFQGYTTAAGDGGQGGITGNASHTMISQATLDFLQFIDLHMHNVGSNYVLNLDNNITVVRCEIDTASTGGLNIDVRANVRDCYIHNVSTWGMIINTGIVTGNRIEDGANTIGTTAIHIATGTTLETRVDGNIIKLTQAGAKGINLNGGAISVSGNSVFNSALGTAAGIQLNAVEVYQVENNLVEGWAGAGGVGIAGTGEIHFMRGNGADGNTTNYTASGMLIDDDNEALAASPFASTTTFEPADTGNVLEGAYPTADIGATITYSRDKGAVQLTPAGGGGGAPGNMAGGLQ